MAMPVTVSPMRRDFWCVLVSTTLQGSTVSTVPLSTRTGHGHGPPQIQPTSVWVSTAWFIICLTRFTLNLKIPQSEFDRDNWRYINNNWRILKKQSKTYNIKYFFLINSVKSDTSPHWYSNQEKELKKCIRPQINFTLHDSFNNIFILLVNNNLFCIDFLCFEVTYVLLNQSEGTEILTEGSSAHLCIVFRVSEKWKLTNSEASMSYHICIIYLMLYTSVKMKFCWRLPSFAFSN